jgi:hypothetical protein
MGVLSGLLPEEQRQEQKSQEGPDSHQSWEGTRRGLTHGRKKWDEGGMLKQNEAAIRIATTT